MFCLHCSINYLEPKPDQCEEGVYNDNNFRHWFTIYLYAKTLNIQKQWKQLQSIHCLLNILADVHSSLKNHLKHSEIKIQSESFTVTNWLFWFLSVCIHILYHWIISTVAGGKVSYESKDLRIQLISCHVAFKSLRLI